MELDQKIGKRVEPKVTYADVGIQTFTLKKLKQSPSFQICQEKSTIEDTSDEEYDAFNETASSQDLQHTDIIKQNTYVVFDQTSYNVVQRVPYQQNAEEAQHGFKLAL